MSQIATRKSVEGFDIYYPQLGKNDDADAYERSIFPVLKEEKLEFKFVEARNLGPIIDKIPTCKFDNVQERIAGFEFFNPLEKLVAGEFRFAMMFVDGQLVGVIKIGRYNSYNYMRNSVNYIDISAPYRNKGYASKLIESLGVFLYDEINIPLFITEETPMGKAAGITNLFRKNMPGFDIFTIHDQRF